MSDNDFDINQRPIPEAALRDKNSVEMLRVWIAENGLHCSMKVGMYRETMKVPEEVAWGRILADVARHLANALESGYSVNSLDALQKIRDCFNREIDTPTTRVSGGFVRKH